MLKIPSDSNQSQEIELVFQKGVFYVSSRIVAKLSGKIHEDLIKHIRKIRDDLGKLEGGAGKFSGTYVDWEEPDRQGKSRPTILMSREGFDLVSMSLQGRRYLGFKMQVLGSFRSKEDVALQIAAAKKTSVRSPASFLKGVYFDLEDSGGFDDACWHIIEGYRHTYPTGSLKLLLQPKIENREKAVFNGNLAERCIQLLED